MKNYFKIILPLLVFSLVAFIPLKDNAYLENIRSYKPVHNNNYIAKASVHNTHIKAATYNIRYRAEADEMSGNRWAVRKNYIAELILKNGIDVMGTQEGDLRQMSDLIQLMPGYDFIGYPYGGKNSLLHTASIVYNRGKLQVLDQGVYWYSETPEIKSLGWDATDTRIATWAKMRDRFSGQEFYFFTSHFYWRYQIAKRNSGKTMVDQIKKITGDDNLPIISTGDFNSNPISLQVIDILTYLKDAYHKSEREPKGPYKTAFRGGVFTGEPRSKIDYIFVNEKVGVKSYEVLTNSYDGRYPSDHLPIVCDLILHSN